MNNIFLYSPKELTTDAFLAWYVKEFDRTTASQKLASEFFYGLGLCDSANDLICDIHVSKQEKNTDLIIRYSVNGQKTQALFENKTYTSTHSDQLKRYSENFPDFHYYKYMKLGYINFAEKKHAKDSGYDVIDVCQLRSALGNYPSNLIADQYREFLEIQFIKVQNEIRNDLIKDNKYQLFENSEAQQYILSTLHENIDQQIPYLYFKHSANSGGTPWTELDIAKRENAYGDKTEYLFWRIDKRGKGYYLRLNQYSYIDAQYWPQKEKNLRILRDFVSSLFKKHGLAIGQISNRGIKETEIAILFFVDNHLSKITPLLPLLSQDIFDFYSSFNKWV